MGEMKLFEALNQLKQLLHKTINCFEELVNATKTDYKCFQSVTY